MFRPGVCLRPPLPRQDLEYVVRQHLGEQLDDIARFCRSAGKEAGYRLIIEVRNLSHVGQITDARLLIL